MKILKKIGICLFLFSFLILPIFTHAQQTFPNNPNQPNAPTGSGSGGGNITIPNPLKDGTNDFMSLVTLVLNKIIMPLAAIGVVIFIIYAGFQFVMAQGNPAKITEAKQRLLWGLIGAGILLGAAGISEVVKNTINGLVQ